MAKKIDLMQPMHDDEDKSTSLSSGLDSAKFELEKWKAEEDVKLRRRELAIKRLEASKSKSHWAINEPNWNYGNN